MLVGIGPPARGLVTHEDGVYLLANGNIIRGARIPDVDVFQGGGQGGRIQEITWDGEVVWEFDFATDQHLLHHDIEILPNGNILAIAWEAKTADQVGAAGGDPAATPASGLWPDMVIEIEPQGAGGGRVVWDYRDAHSGDVRMADGSMPHPVGEFTYAVFRVTRIPPDHPALAGKVLQPLDPQPPLAGEDGGGP